MGPGLGLFDDAGYGTVACPVEAGDRLVLFTDGIFEVDSPAGEEFGQNGMLELIQRTMDTPGECLGDAVLAEVRDFSGSHDFTDDVCLVCVDVRRLGSGG
jgi:serine phosphatase RsbU (regulator of sigma subunit)